MSRNNNPSTVLDLFLPPVRAWFAAELGPPTPPQSQGWPAIAAGRHTLILAPTGSGKTLAAFLACLDALWRQPQLPRGVQVLYISPLKALNNDIYRNLQVPLEGVARTAAAMNFPLPAIDSAVRTGDTPTAERQRLVRQPPHVLITTPESLHLMLTSRARDTLRSVRYVIVDEIHALCTTKRGVFLALLLERLAALNPDGFVRVGLSATQRPLEEVARYLGGLEPDATGGLVPRPVTIVDAGLRKELDLQIVNPVDQFGPLPEKSVWPSIYRLLVEQIRSHRSTIVFANDRRGVERLTAQINEADTESRPAEAGDGEALLARAHHGSVALEVRRATEEALKEGRLRAVVATASLEMGIDMGAVELVCQVASPGTVARGLQRVGRAGHLVGHKSKGRLIPRNLADLLEQAVLAREMTAGHVEECKVPANCLDVLAQQVVALAAVDEWPVDKLFGLVRRAYPYRHLTAAALETVLEMVSGRYRFDPIDADDPTPGAPRLPGQSMNALQPRLSWDRVGHRLLALPGSQQLALVHGGTIPDTGQYAVYTIDGVRVGEIDEEFTYERRVGESFTLGTNTWRVERIEADRVIVTPAGGEYAFLPFWRGEGVGRSYELGTAIGRFLGELRDRLDDDGCQAWLREQFHLDAPAARNLRWHVLRQLDKTGCLPTDRTVYIEASRDQLGDWQVILLGSFGRQVHLALRLALEARLKQRLGYRPQCLHHDDGVLVRLTDSELPVLDLFDGLTADNVQSLVMGELIDSPLFALRFRQNAARALLLPTGGAGKRAPLWLQRLRGRDLLQVARRHPDFPIVVETFRECLEDYLDLPRVRQLLADVHGGEVQVVTAQVETPSPFASGVLFAFTAANMYQTDAVEPDSAGGGKLDHAVLEQILSSGVPPERLDPRAVRQVDDRLRGVGRPPRSATEMAEWLRKLGDLTPAELHGPLSAYLEELAADGRATRLEVPGQAGFWVLTEEAAAYQAAFGLAEAAPGEQTRAAEAILYRYLSTHALVSLADVLARYPFDREWARSALEKWAKLGRVVSVPAAGGEPLRWSPPEVLEQVQRTTLAILRREVTTCRPDQFADFLHRWHGLHPQHQGERTAALSAALDALQGVYAPADLWEQVLLPTRVPGYLPKWLDEQLQTGEWAWACRAGDGGSGGVTFVRRELLPELPPAVPPEVGVGPAAEAVLSALGRKGAVFAVDLARDTGLSPVAVRKALWELLRLGLVTNDRFDPVRSGEPPAEEVPAGRFGLRRRGFRPPAPPPEGRWSLVPWGRPDVEVQAVACAWLLLHRHGVAARELAQMDPQLPPWRVLYEVLGRLELAGEVRRGYFVEGLSGAQFALPEACQQLQEVATPTRDAPAILVHSLDPANLYGSAAPFDIPLLDGGTKPFLRRPGNWLVLSAGRPVLVIEQQGKKLTSMPGATEAQLAAAVALLPKLLRHDQALAAKHKLTVSNYNEGPVTGTPLQPLLETHGFVRDYQDLTLYAGWQ